MRLSNLVIPLPLIILIVNQLIIVSSHPSIIHKKIHKLAHNKHLKKKLLTLGILSNLAVRKKYVLPVPLPLPVPVIVKRIPPPIVLPPKKYPVLVPKPVPVYRLVPKFVPVHHHKKVLIVPQPIQQPQEQMLMKYSLPKQMKPLYQEQSYQESDYQTQDNMGDYQPQESFENQMRFYSGQGGMRDEESASSHEQPMIMFGNHEFQPKHQGYHQTQQQFLREFNKQLRDAGIEDQYEQVSQDQLNDHASSSSDQHDQYEAIRMIPTRGSFANPRIRVAGSESSIRHRFRPLESFNQYQGSLSGMSGGFSPGLSGISMSEFLNQPDHQTSSSSSSRYTGDGDLLMSSSDHMPAYSMQPMFYESPEGQRNSGHQKEEDQMTKQAREMHHTKGIKNFSQLPVTPDEVKAILNQLKTLDDEIRLLPDGKLTLEDPNLGVPGEGKSGEISGKKVQVGEIRIRPEELRTLLMENSGMNERVGMLHGINGGRKEEGIEDVGGTINDEDLTIEKREGKEEKQ